MRAMPARLHPRVRALFDTQHPRGLWSHQAEAIDASLSGRAVCLATPTASGKSLVFQSICLHNILSRPGTRALIMYPTKALAEDQLGRWSKLAASLNLRVERIDGDIPTDKREATITRADVLIMTPDVVHAWWMANLERPKLRAALGSLSTIVLDEAHVYEGVFGSNMAYLMRRIRCQLDSSASILTATATIHAPDTFITELTGQTPVVFGAGEDGSPRHIQRVTALQCSERHADDMTVELLRTLAQRPRGRFLVFADSRRDVELVMNRLRRAACDDPSDEHDDDELDDERPASLDHVLGVMSYRAGYEDEDRRDIQRALSEGHLRGVIATSALELGIDLGEVDTVVCLGLPLSARSMVQRLGRAGRLAPSQALILDTRAELCDEADLKTALSRPPEPCRLYLSNRYLQLSQALCTAKELRATGRAAKFEDLPQGFMTLLETELGGGCFETDLEEMRRAGEASPHHAFPLRNAIEQRFDLKNGYNRLGELQMAQMMREAYPGGTYYHMGRGYEVLFVNKRSGTIAIKRGKSMRTSPNKHNFVRVSLASGVLGGRVSERGFAVEATLMATERLIGFTTHKGDVRDVHLYGPDSRYSREAISRYITTTGVALHLPGVELSLAFAEALTETMTRGLGVHPQDLGAATFSYEGPHPLGTGKIGGICIFDMTHGSLRLSGLLLEHMEGLLREVARHDDELVRQTAHELATWWPKTAPWHETLGVATGESMAPNGIKLIAPGSTAMLLDGMRQDEVEVERVRFHPRYNTLVYRLKSATGVHEVPLTLLQPIAGLTQLDTYLPDDDEWLNRRRVA
jgi:DEAD/DEAH box helicase domain-containing protein